MSKVETLKHNGVEMNLVASRDRWAAKFKYGGPGPIILEVYRANRDSENWRTSNTVEQLCEYILNLEEMILEK